MRETSAPYTTGLGREGGASQPHRPLRHRARALAASAAAIAVVIPFLGAIGAAPASAATGEVNRLETVMHVPSIITRSRLVSHVSATATVRGAVGLRPRNEAVLSEFISSVTTKGSPSYHHYLTKGEFANRFGPTKATIDAVKSALTSAGLSVGKVAPNGLLVNFSGSTTKVESAFHTTLANYKLPNGDVGRATSTAVKLPASISSKVTVVAGLDNLVHAQSAGLIRATTAQRKAGSYPAAKASPVPHVAGAPSACAAAQSDAATYGGLTDDQIANAYGAFGLYQAGDTGQGQSIAVFELEPFAPSDVLTFDQCYFGNTAAAAMAGRLHTIPIDGGQAAGPGSGESILDVDDVSALAPGANIDVYEAPNNTFGSLDEYNTIVNADSDQVITTSWGLCETAIQQGEPGFQQEENSIFEQAAAQGQSVFAAAGDTGDDTCNEFRTPSPVAPVLSVGDPGSQPYVTSVGGTTIDNATQPPQEHVWNDGAQWGSGGGGISNTFVMPSWQAAATVPGIDPSKTVATAEAIEGDDFCQGNADGASAGGSQYGEPCREVPDVSAEADEFTGAITIYSASFGPGDQGWITIGGTSSATPIWAALIADVNASSTCQSNVATRTGVGFVTPLLYAVASNPTAYAASFNDITSGNNDIYDLDNGSVFAATPGYDMASGLGSPQLTTPSGGDGLAYYLCSYALSQTRPSITSLSPSVIDTDGDGTPFTITGTGFETDGVSSVSQLWMNNILVPTSDYQVTSPTTIKVLGVPGSLLAPTAAVSDGSGPVDVAVSLADGETSAITGASILDSVDTNASGGDVPAVTGVSSYGGSESGGNVVEILGSGFSSSVRSVTFGGVSSSNFTVDSPYEITATVPPYSQATGCATDLNAATDVCQTEVVVNNGDGASQEYPILPTYEGALNYDDNAVLPAPPGCDCEVVPSPSEYDYFPTPVITSVSATNSGPNYASEAGTTTVTITGSGFNDFALIGAIFGPPSQNSSLDLNISYLTGTEMQVIAPAEAQTVDPTSVPVTIDTIAGLSNAATAWYSGVPQLTSVSPPAAPDTGGQLVQASGDGFANNQVLYAVFVDAISPFSVATDYQLDPISDTSATLLNPQQNPAIVTVSFCTTSGCSNPTEDDTMIIYPPGNPVVASSSPISGPAHGGTEVTISGSNLGCATAVYFGKTIAASFSNASAFLDCGSTTSITAMAPPGTAGTTVPITVDTVESEVTGAGPSAAVDTARFTYERSSPSAPQDLKLTPGANSLKASWKAPLSTGGGAITYVAKASAKGYATQTKKLSGSTTSTTFKKLFWGATWTVTVTAHNAYGTSASVSGKAEPKS